MSDTPAVADEQLLHQLHDRLRATRIDQGLGSHWSRGTDHAYLTGIVDYWAEGYDWRTAEARILALPWTRTSNGMRAVHQRAADPAAPVVVLLHGGPDSFLRFTRVLPLLADVHVVVPCLPGFPHSDLPGSSREAMAETDRGDAGRARVRPVRGLRRRRRQRRR